MLKIMKHTIQMLCFWNILEVYIQTLTLWSVSEAYIQNTNTVKRSWSILLKPYFRHMLKLHFCLVFWETRTELQWGSCPINTTYRSWSCLTTQVISSSNCHNLTIACQVYHQHTGRLSHCPLSLISLTLWSKLVRSKSIIVPFTIMEVMFWKTLSEVDTL